MNPARRAALAALRHARTADYATGAAQEARDTVACRIASALADGVTPEPENVEAFRILDRLAERSVRLLEQRVDARYALTFGALL